MPKAPRQIQLRFFAILREQAGCSSLAMTTSAVDARALYSELQARFPNLKFPAELLRVSINERYAELTTPLSAGDRVVFIPPVAGG